MKPSILILILFFCAACNLNAGDIGAGVGMGASQLGHEGPFVNPFPFPPPMTIEEPPAQPVQNLQNCRVIPTYIPNTVQLDCQ
jgi:hypothetical protein